ncbi:unnamed protein product [Parajaminaea phylloscopi]
MSASAALPDEALRRVLDQIQMTLTQSHRQLSMVKAQRAGKEREKKGIELTRLGVESEAAQGAKTYRGVGKMFIADSPDAIISTLKAQEKSVEDEMEALSKKQKFLEKQVADAQGHMRDFFQGIERQQSADKAGAPGIKS